MYCPRCGSLNNDTASVCSNCGNPVPAISPLPPVDRADSGQSMPPPGMPNFGQVPPRQLQLPPEIPTYLWQAIAVTVCCCLPFGIVAIVKAADVGTKMALHDYVGARASSDSARFWCWIGFGAGLLFLFGYFLLVVFGVISESAWQQDYDY